jgi:hypothetical protein
MPSGQASNISLCEVPLCTEDAVLWCFCKCIHRIFPNGSHNLQEMSIKTNNGNGLLLLSGNIYLRRPTKSDTMNIVDLHLQVHNIPGTIGSLNVAKFHWKNCPTAWKANFKVKRSLQD